MRPKAMEAYDLLEIGEYSLRLNDDPAPEELENILDETSLLDYLGIPSQCPFCQSLLVSFGNFDLSKAELIFTPKQYHLWYCRNCRFWQWYYYFDSFAEEDKVWTGEGCPPSPEQLACISKLREFNHRLPDSCSTELAQYLRSKPSEWHRFEPKCFERLVADIFRANYAGAEVIHVGKPDDGGMDVIFIDTSSQQWLIQVKRRERQGSTEGVSTIRNLIGTMILEGAMRGIVVSTADHFSLRAKQAARHLKKKGFYIELIDRGILNRMLDPILPDRPWLNVVGSVDNEVADLLSARIISDYQLSLFDFR
ncbi:MAG TPA: restriction endonuclease [Candidatus Saccharimonadales bacterium]|nr:restriction endonuclease [Candidatus Saccharimonadales bacterium]